MIFPSFHSVTPTFFIFITFSYLFCILLFLAHSSIFVCQHFMALYGHPEQLGESGECVCVCVCVRE